MDYIQNYVLSSFPISCQYDDENEHIIRLSKNVYSIDVASSRTNPDTQIKKFDSGLNIEYIQQSCFINCQSLTDVNIKPNVRVIDNDAFLNCENLSNLNMDYVYGIGSEAFRNCGISQLNLDLRRKDDGTEYDYEGCIPTIIEIGPYVGDYAFADCKKLTDVILCTSTELGNHMFDGCSSLSSITFSNHGQCVGYYTFQNCTSLESITLPQNFEMLSKGMFKGCTNLKSVNIDPNSTKFENIEQYVFEECPNLTSITLPSTINTIENIDDNAFKNSNLGYIKLNGINSETLNDYLKPTVLATKMNPIKYEGDLKYATWYKFSEKLLKDCIKLNIPLFAIRCMESCGRCKSLKEQILNKKEFRQWMGEKYYIFAYYENQYVSKFDTNYYLYHDENPEYEYQMLWEGVGTTVPQYAKLWTKEDGDDYHQCKATHFIRFNKENIKTLTSWVDKKFENYDPNPKFISDYQKVEDDVNFECFGVKDGCILESQDGIKYKWVLNSKVLIKI